MVSRPTDTALTPHHIARAAAAAGLAPAPLLARAGIDAAGDFERRVPTARVFELWELVMRELRRPSFPIDAARVPPSESRSVLTFLCRSSRTLREASGHLLRHFWLATEAHALRAAPVRGGVAFVLDENDHATLGERCAVEFHVGSTVLGATALGAPPPARVAFRHPAPPDTTAQRALAADVRFSAPRTEFVYADAALDAPLPSATPALESLLARHVEAVAARLQGSARGTSRVRTMLVAAIREGRAPTRGAAAAGLGVSMRTLARRLADEGVSFRSVLDDTRRELANELLDGERTVKEVADLLGFADVRSFYRAFRRWTGKTPRDRGS